jgi:hypothetical protein
VAINLPVAAVGKKIGGAVQKNIELPVGGFENACPIRMSYVLNTVGFPILRSPRYGMVTGGDKRQYIYRVNDMMSYLEHTFGKPDKTVRSPKPSDFVGTKGIIVVKGHGWGNAKGHVTLWNGAKCSDACHLMRDPENGPFVPETASIWTLP